jgi:hypothetical protein
MIRCWSLKRPSKPCRKLVKARVRKRKKDDRNPHELVNKLLRVLQTLSALSIVGQLPSWSGEEVECQTVGSKVGRIFAKRKQTVRIVW